MLCRYMYLLCFSCLFGGLSACGASSSNPATPLTMSRVVPADEPCWIRTPDCQAGEADAHFYFVGQSKEPLPSVGRPLRASFRSAQLDAEHEYARFLGVDIESSSYLKSLFASEQYQLQFEETIRQEVSQSVRELVKADTYYVADERTQEGVPMWTVYVLLKIAREHVSKHQSAILEEARRRADAPPPADEWVASVFNVDDSVAIYVNDTKINQCDFSQSCDVKLSPHLVSGRNQVRFEFINHALFWTYGYEVRKNGEVMYKGRCGQVWVLGCGFLDLRLGVVHAFSFEVEKT
ncbi:MAG: hypothetical protein VX834_07555 [Myxococcota bacterium]|nr:hypothetical protein [Myxococcota bacterium]